MSMIYYVQKIFFQKTDFLTFFFFYCRIQNVLLLYYYYYINIIIYYYYIYFQVKCLNCNYCEMLLLAIAWNKTV